VESLLDRAGKIIALLAGVAGIGGALIGLISAVERPHVQLQIDKDKNRIPPRLLSQLHGLGAEYQDPDFGSVTLDITNRTATEVKPTLEVGGLKKFDGVEVVDSQLAGRDLSDYQDKLNRLALQPGKPCPSKQGTTGDQKLDLPIPPLQSYGGHITLALYGMPFEFVDACLNGAPVETRYLIRIQDSAMLHRYPVWLVSLSLVLVATATFLFIQSHSIKTLKSKAAPEAAPMHGAAEGR
jgi:hypothetical protein